MGQAGKYRRGASNCKLAPRKVKMGRRDYDYDDDDYDDDYDEEEEAEEERARHRRRMADLASILMVIFICLFFIGFTSYGLENMKIARQNIPPDCMQQRRCRLQFFSTPPPDGKYVNYIWERDKCALDELCSELWIASATPRPGETPYPPYPKAVVEEYMRQAKENYEKRKAEENNK